jgi:two-component system chemotaxis sensor kinase CheA
VVKPLSSVLREIGLFSGATVLGNGTLALILDIGATAARAGVKPVEGVTEEVELVEAKTEDAAEASFMVFEDRVKERTALPLDVVERIESVPLSQIEYAGGRALLQYRGELLPLSDDGNLLAEIDAGGASEEELVTVLICANAGAEGRHRIGMVVRRVLDVSSGRMLEEDAATEGMELALVKEKLTMVHHQFGAKAAGWREVA